MIILMKIVNLTIIHQKKMRYFLHVKKMIYHNKNNNKK